MDDQKHRRLHESLGFLGLRGAATARGLLQLTAELVRAGVLDEEAVNRIKDAIACDLVLSRPRSAWRGDIESSIRERLDDLFETSCR